MIHLTCLPNNFYLILIFRTLSVTNNYITETILDDINQKTKYKPIKLLNRILVYLIINIGDADKKYVICILAFIFYSLL